VQLLQAAWGAINAVAKQVVSRGTAANEVVVRGLVKVLRAPVEAGGVASIPALPRVLPAVVSVLRATGSPGALEAAVGIITELGDCSDQKVQDLFVTQGGEALKIASQAFARALDAAGHGVARRSREHGKEGDADGIEGTRQASGHEGGNVEEHEDEASDPESESGAGGGGGQDLGVSLFGSVTRLVALAPRTVLADPGR